MIRSRMAANVNVEFCRTMLSLTLEAVRKHTTAQERKDAWVIKTGRQDWEFHGPGEYYWHGHADNAYDARAQGWAKWLVANGHEE